MVICRRVYANGTLELFGTSGGGGAGSYGAPGAVRCRAANAHGIALSRDVLLQPGQYCTLAQVRIGSVSRTTDYATMKQIVFSSGLPAGARAMITQDAQSHLYSTKIIRKIHHLFNTFNSSFAQHEERVGATSCGFKFECKDINYTLQEDYLFCATVLSQL